MSGVVSDAHSPNLARWLKRHGKRPLGRPNIFRDHDGVRWIGWIDDTEWFIGTRLMRVLCDGSRATPFAYGKLAQSLKLEPNFWPRYSAIGRCAIDEAHRMSFIGDETRWQTDGEVRRCQWCGNCEQRLERWTETIERTRWSATPLPHAQGTAR